MADENTHKLRRRIHLILDPIWRSKRMSRKGVYAVMSVSLGFPKDRRFHVAELSSAECKRAVELARDLALRA